MTDEPETPDGTDEAGRYLYCIVDVSDVSDAATGTSLETDGVDGETPTLVVEDGLAAVVHRRGRPYDSADEATIKRWLLQHQGVVDAAHDRFGTPLPVRFDTIVEGSDDALTSWLERRRSTLQPALDAFAGHSEYRIELRCDADPFGASAVSADDRLDELQTEADEQSSGTAFLRSKQADRRERSLVANQWQETTATVRESLANNAADIQTVDRPVSSLAEADHSDDADFETTFAILADEAGASVIGDRLDEVAAQPGVRVRYTGPWPPYTFTPELEGHQ